MRGLLISSDNSRLMSNCLGGVLAAAIAAAAPPTPAPGPVSPDAQGKAEQLVSGLYVGAELKASAKLRLAASGAASAAGANLAAGALSCSCAMALWQQACAHPVSGCKCGSSCTASFRQARCLRKSLRVTPAVLVAFLPYSALALAFTLHLVLQNVPKVAQEISTAQVQGAVRPRVAAQRTGAGPMQATYGDAGPLDPLVEEWAADGDVDAQQRADEIRRLTVSLLQYKALTTGCQSRMGSRGPLAVRLAVEGTHSVFLTAAVALYLTKHCAALPLRASNARGLAQFASSYQARSCRLRRT